MPVPVFQYCGTVAQRVGGGGVTFEKVETNWATAVDILHGDQTCNAT